MLNPVNGGPFARIIVCHSILSKYKVIISCGSHGRHSSRNRVPVVHQRRPGVSSVRRILTSTQSTDPSRTVGATTCRLEVLQVRRDLNADALNVRSGAEPDSFTRGSNVFARHFAAPDGANRGPPETRSSTQNQTGAQARDGVAAARSLEPTQWRQCEGQMGAREVTRGDEFCRGGGTQHAWHR